MSQRLLLRTTVCCATWDRHKRTTDLQSVSLTQRRQGVEPCLCCVIPPQYFDQKLKNTDYSVSEASICENLIYPVLKETWKSFLSHFYLWSHPTWYVDEVLSGIPDYLFTQPTKYGKAVLGAPVLITVEAKKDNFQEGWGQCAAAMIAAQKLNANNQITIYGIVSNGETWEFAYLEGDRITKNIIGYSIFELHKLYEALHFVLKQSQMQFK